MHFKMTFQCLVEAGDFLTIFISVKLGILCNASKFPQVYESFNTHFLLIEQENYHFLFMFIITKTYDNLKSFKHIPENKI